MPEPNDQIPATVPEQPEAKAPLKKSVPVVIVLIVIVALIGIANISSLVSGNKRSAPASALTMTPTTPNAQQVTSFQSQQQAQARHDAEERQHQQELAAAMQQLQQEPQRYKLFGIYWWPVKALLKRAGYGPDQLFLLGDYQDAAVAARVPKGSLEDTLTWAFEEYGQNARYPHPDGQVELVRTPS